MLNKWILAGSFLGIGASAWGACPSGTAEVSPNTCRLAGRYTSDLNLTADKTWLISGGVFIGGDNTNSATLFIQPGTKILGERGRDYLVVSRGSKILAEGTAAKPILFSSSNKVRGGWGGLIINGKAPINGCDSGVCQAEGEGSTGVYGGSDPFDNSGIIRYVRVEYAGYQITPENELNGIAFQGVGSGTTVEYLQIHMAADDGLEFFGGTVNARHVVITGARDDSLDWVNGWQGKMQYVVIKQYDDEGNNGIEADNLKKNMSAEPRSLPEISNATLIGTTGGTAKGGAGILLRRGTGLMLFNSIVTGFSKSCLDLDDDETFRFGSNGGIAIESTVFQCSKNFDEEQGDLWGLSDWFNRQIGNDLTDPKLVGAISTSSTSLTTPVVPEDFFFDEVDYVGAIRDSGSDWTKGWTVGL